MIRPSKRFWLFAGIGLINTAVDLVSYLLLRSAGLSVFTANVCSTSLGLISSFILNRRYTFKRSKVPPERMVLFVVITLAGIWLLQPIVIKSALHVLHTAQVVALLRTVTSHPSLLADALSKIAAGPASLVFNYSLYKRYVFIHKSA